MSWSGKQKAGGGTVDTVARSQASSAKSLLDKIFSAPNSNISANTETIVDCGVDGILNFKNNTTGTLTIPASPSLASMKTAGFTQLVDATKTTTGIVYNPVADNDTALIEKYNTAEPASNVVVHLTAPAVKADSWFVVTNTGDGIIDVGGTQISGKGQLNFATNDAGTAWVLTSRESITPAANQDTRLSKIYKVAGDSVESGSEVFVILSDGSTVNYRNPTAGALTVPATPTNASVLAAGFAPIAAKENHLHSILANSATLAGSDTIFKVASGKLWHNKIANPDIKLTPADATWNDNWTEFVSGTANKVINQTSHPFTKIGQQAYFDTTSLKYALADNSADDKAEVVGTVSKIVDADNFELITEGWVEGIEQTGLTPGVVFLDSVAGNLTDTLPTTGIIKPVLILVSASSGYVIHRSGMPADAAAASGTTLQDTWRGSANADHSTQGNISFKQVFDAIADGYKFFGTGSWDANIAHTDLNHFVSGYSGVSVNNFPQGLSSPQGFISEYYGSAVEGTHRLTIFGPPSASRGLWYRYRSSSTWGPWTRETGNAWEYTPDPATPGTEYFVSDGWIAINDGDKLKLNATAQKSALRACPVSDWSNVPAITLSASAVADGWAIEGTQPSSGTQVIEFLPDTLYKKWLIRRVDDAAAIATLTNIQAQSNSDTSAGIVTGKLLYDREQALKGTQANFTDTDADYSIAKSWDAETLEFRFPDLAQTDAEDNTSTFFGLVSGERLWQAIKKLHADLLIHLPDPSALTDGQTVAVSNKSWVAVAPVTPSQVWFGSGTPDSADTTHLVWVDTSTTLWPLYSRALASNAWPATSSGNVFDALVNLTQPQAEDKTSTTFGAVSGERLAQAIDKNIKTDLETLLGVAVADKDLGTFTGNIIPDDVTIKDALQALETKMAAFEITGRFIGSADTYATLPTSNTNITAAVNEDWTYKRTTEIGTGTALAPQYPKGVYIYDGTKYDFAFDFSVELVDLTQSQAEDKASTVFGMVSGERLSQAVVKNTMVGANATTAGKAGSVAAPAAGDQGKFLKGDGTWADIVTGKASQFASKTSVTVAATGRPTANEIKTWAAAQTTKVTNALVYYTGTDTSTDAPTYMFWSDINGNVNRLDQEESTYVFISDTDITYTGYSPTISEVTTWVNAQTIKPRNKFLYWTGTDLSTEVAPCIWFIDANGAIQALRFPAEGALIPWRKQSEVVPGCLRTVTIGTTSCTIQYGPSYQPQSTANTTNLALAEMAFWIYISQGSIDAFPASTDVLAGFKILVNNEVWRALNTHKTNATFDAAEQGKWARESASYVTTSLTAAGNLTGNKIHLLKVNANATFTIAANQVSSFYTTNVDGKVYTVSAPAGETINGVASITSTRAGEILFCIKNGTNWNVTRILPSNPITVQTGLHAFNETSTTNPSASFAVTFPAAFANAPRVELTYQWNYNASTNGTLLSPPVVLDGTPSTTGFNYRINGSRNTLDRVSWTAIDTLSTVDAGNVVLTPRAITGSATGTGYDGVPVPVQITPVQGQVLSTVTATNGATISNINPSLWTCNVTVNSSATVLSHTSVAGATFQGLQRVMVSTTELALTASLQTYTMPSALMEGDLLEVQHQYNSSSAERQFVWVRVQAGTTQRNFPWADATNNTHYWVFPATLDATFQVRQITASSSPRIMSIRVWRDAANGYCIPTGYSVGRTYSLTVNGGTNGTFTGFEGIGPQPFILTGMIANQEVDVFPVVAGVSLLNRQAGLFTVDRALNGGNLALTGITFRNLGFKSKYFGTADNQAGDAAATNGGHTFTQRYMTGNGITTANGSTFTLSGGIYRIRYSVTHHKGPNAWSARALFVDGGEVTSIYTGSDGSNWESGGDLEWIVDATSASHTVQMRRTASSNNGNVDCWLAIEREEGYALPEGYQTREACAITASGGSFATGLTSINIPTGTGQWVSFTLGAGNELKSCSGSAGLTVSTVDMKAGAAWVEVANGTTSGTLTVVIGARSPTWAQSTVNRGVVVNLGSLKLQATPSGNMNFQIASNTGALITAKVSTTAPSYSGSSPDGTGDVTLSLAANGAFQSPRNFNFGGQGNIQTMLIEDQTNSRRYFVNCEVGAAFSNNIISGFEV